MYAVSLAKISRLLQADTLLKGYPDEWFPSVSATIGDRYPERSVFQLFIAMTSGTLSRLELSEISELLNEAQVLGLPWYFSGTF